MRKNVKYLILGFSLLLIAASSICIPIFVIGQIRPSQNSNQNLIYGTGVIIYVPLEGGFFGIISDDGNKYDPINLEPEFEIDGLRIMFMGELLNLFSIHMWGRIISIVFIQKF